MKRLVFVLGVLAGLAASAATDFASLQAEIDAAEPGATVYVENDMAYTSELVIEKDITIASPEGQTNVVTRGSTGTGRFLTLDTNNTATVTFRNITIDGDRKVNPGKQACIALYAGKVIFGAGATLRNYENVSASSSVYTCKTSVFEMQTGSAIRDCVNKYYASAVQIGASSDAGTNGTFIMSGGEITDCDTTTAAPQSDPQTWGGAVYVYGGTFRFSGGTITRNTSANAVAGVSVFKGALKLTGNGIILGNTGGAVNDVALCSASTSWNAACYMEIGANYGGWMTVKLFDGRDQEGLYTSRIDLKSANSKWNGTANIMLQDSDLCLDGYNLAGSGYYPVWTKPVAKTKYYNITGFDHMYIGPTDTITLYADWPRASYISITDGKDVTVESGKGGPYRVYMTENHYYPFWVENASLHLRNVIVDGRADEGFVTGGTDWFALVIVGRQGKVYLEDGAILRNASNDINSVGIDLHYETAYCEMQKGAMICDMTTKLYGSAVTVGRTSSSVAEDQRARFVMTGGVISNCVCTTDHASRDFGGAVYVWGGCAELLGGTITCNRSENSVGGVNYFTGRLDLGGDIRIWDNIAAYPDLSCFSSSSVNPPYARLVSDLTGRIGISNGDGTKDRRTRIRALNGATGAWNIFPTGVGADTSMTCYDWYNAKDDAHLIYYGAADNWVDGTGFVGAYEECASALAPTTVDLDAETTLPHVFTGKKARALGGTLTVTAADADAWRAANGDRLPLRLLEGTDGPLTGTWTFELPPPGELGHWKVVSRTTDTGSAYDLKWAEDGLLLFVR